MPSNKKGKRLNRDLLQSIVDNCEKQRFSISEDGLRIRAAQGHSVKNIDIDYQADNGVWLTATVAPEFIRF